MKISEYPIVDPTDNDSVVIVDAETWTNKRTLFSRIGTYLGSLYQPLSSVLTNTTASYTIDINARLASTSGSNTGDNATNTQYSGLATSKQDTLVSGTNIKTVNGASVLGSGDIATPGVTDGDKWDITVSASGTIWTIDPSTVTNSKLANMATKTYKGRTSAGTWASEDVSVAILKADLALWNVDNTSDATKNSATVTLTNKTLTKPTFQASVQNVVTIAATVGGTTTLDLSTSNCFIVTLGGNTTIALSNATVGQHFWIKYVQDATWSRIVTQFTTIKWAGGTAPTLTTTANKYDWMGHTCTSAGNYDGVIIWNNI